MVLLKKMESGIIRKDGQQGFSDYQTEVTEFIGSEQVTQNKTK